MADTGPWVAMASASGASCCLQQRQPHEHKFLSLAGLSVQSMPLWGPSRESQGMLQLVKGFPRVDCALLSTTVSHGAGWDGKGGDAVS